MKNLLRIFAIVLALAFVIPQSTAQAGDYVADAVAALQTSSVYVAPGTPGTDHETASKLTFFLKEGDSIVLVMLPEEALQGTNIFDIARSISEGLNNQKIIGLAVGKELIGYSVLLPDGMATDLMSRADTITQEPVSALITFSQYVASWEATNPIPTATPLPEPTRTPRPPIELPKAKDITFPVWMFLTVLFFLPLQILAIRVFRRVKKERYKKKLESMAKDQ